MLVRTIISTSRKPLQIYQSRHVSTMGTPRTTTNPRRRYGNLIVIGISGLIASLALNRRYEHVAKLEQLDIEMARLQEERDEARSKLSEMKQQLLAESTHGVRALRRGKTTFEQWITNTTGYQSRGDDDGKEIATNDKENMVQESGGGRGQQPKMI